MLIWIMGIIAVVVVVEAILLYLYIRTLNKMFHSMEKSATEFKMIEGCVGKLVRAKLIADAKVNPVKIRSKS